MSRIVVPIPQEEELRQPKFAFTERPDGLPVVEAETTADHIAAFRNVTEELDDHYWAQAAVAASLSKKYGNGEYGKGEMNKLADAVELTANYLFRMARTYRTFTESFPRERKLYFKHHVIAAGHARPDEALSVAVERGMSCGALEAWVSEQSLRRANKATKKAIRAVRNDWREHLLHMDQLIVEDFIRNSPNQEYARRVCGEWRVEIADELKQLEFTENRELVINAIDERGAEDAKAIRQATGVEREEVNRIIGCLVAENLYEWIPKGGKGDDQRGSPAMILHKVGDLDGGAYTEARPEHQYMH